MRARTGSTTRSRGRDVMRRCGAARQLAALALGTALLAGALGLAPAAGAGDGDGDANGNGDGNGHGGTENQCIVCHLELDDETLTPPAALYASDIHVRADISCTGCHGGDATSDDAELAMSPARGFTGKPETADIPDLCGKCHSNEVTMKQYAPSLPTDQEEKYWTSRHGQALAGGDTEVATCVSCHGVHQIRQVSDPGSPVYATKLPGTCKTCHGDAELMQRHGLSSNQYAQYAQSVHGVALLEKGDVGAPACNDCHGSHGAQPPGLAAVHYVCGTCHFNNREFFMQSPHAEAFADLDEGECIACHGYHGVQSASDGMLGLGEDAVCARCHDAGDAGGQVAVRLKAMVDSLRTTQGETRALVHRAEQLGMPVDETIYLLGESHENLVKMRTEIHAVSVDAVRDDYRVGSDAAGRAHSEAARLIGEFGYRRRGLIVASLLNTALIVLVIAGIRRLDRKRAA